MKDDPSTVNDTKSFAVRSEKFHPIIKNSTSTSLGFDPDFLKNTISHLDKVDLHLNQPTPPISNHQPPIPHQTSYSPIIIITTTPMWWSRIIFPILSSVPDDLGETLVVQKWNKSLITNWNSRSLKQPGLLIVFVYFKAL